MGVSSFHIQLTEVAEMKMMPTTFLLITLLCVLPPPPVASKNVKLKHVHNEIHKILDSMRTCSNQNCPGCTTEYDCIDAGSPCCWCEEFDPPRCIFDCMNCGFNQE